MYKNIKFKGILVVLLMIMGILSFKLVSVVNKNNWIKGQSLATVAVDKKLINIEKYGYSDILELIRKNNNFGVKTINMRSDEICNIQVDYSGDIRSLYTSLYSLNESRNFLCFNSININKEEKTTTISMDFKKNK